MLQSFAGVDRGDGDGCGRGCIAGSDGNAEGSEAWAGDGVGVEDVDDIIEDLEQAFVASFETNHAPAVIDLG